MSRKVDMSFIKLAETDEDFKREVYDHGVENLLVSASAGPSSLPPSIASLMTVPTLLRSGRRLHQGVGPVPHARHVLLQHILWCAARPRRQIQADGMRPHPLSLCGRPERRRHGREVCAGVQRQDHGAHGVP